MNINVNKGIYVKSDNPESADIFVVIRKNNSQTPYLIVKYKPDTYNLINLNSGYINYIGNSISELVENYLKSNIDNKTLNSMNPIKGYFFIKSYEASILTERTFGYVNLKLEE